MRCPCSTSPRRSISGCATRARRCALVGAHDGQAERAGDAGGCHRPRRQVRGAGRLRTRDAASSTLHLFWDLFGLLAVTK